MLIDIPASVFQVMTRQLRTAREDDGLCTLVAALRTTNCRHIPVTDGRQLVGLITARELAPLSRWPHGLSLGGAHEGIPHCRVGDVMRRDVVTVTPQTSLREAGALLLEQDVGCLPVLDENNALVGMLTSSDYVRLVVKAARGRV